MAYLSQDEDRESWLAWAIELMRRGLSPTGDIVVHGPHAPPADCMWGEANVKDLKGECFDVQFTTPHGLTPRDKWKVRNVRVTYDYTGGNFPILPERELPEEWRTRLNEMKQEREKLREEWRAAMQKRAELVKELSRP